MGFKVQHVRLSPSNPTSSLPFSDHVITRGFFLEMVTYF